MQILAASAPVQRNRVKVKAKGASESEVNQQRELWTPSSWSRSTLFVTNTDTTPPPPPLPPLHSQFLDTKSADRVLKLAHEQQYEEESAVRPHSLHSVVVSMAAAFNQPHA